MNPTLASFPSAGKLETAVASSRRRLLSIRFAIGNSSLPFAEPAAPVDPLPGRGSYPKPSPVFSDPRLQVGRPLVGLGNQRIRPFLSSPGSTPLCVSHSHSARKGDRSDGASNREHGQFNQNYGV